MQKYKKILLILLLIPVIAKPCDCGKEQKTFETNYPYLYYNLAIIAQSIRQLSFFATLERKSQFKDAPDEEIAEIKNIAKDLKFSDEEIKKISVKKPRKYNEFDFIFLNNYASFFYTIIIGRQNIDILKKLDQNPDAKKFLYAHELSHTKYNHSGKLLALKILLPIAVELGIMSFNSIFRHILKNLQPQYNNKIIEFALKYTPEVLNFYGTKIALQVFLTSIMQKKFEKNADIGAASLGPDVINGGIKFFEASKKLDEETHTAIVNKFSNTIVKKFVSGLLTLKEFFNYLIDTHPSDEKRIKYLKAKLLELENQAKLEKAKQDAQNAQARIA